MIYIDTNVLIYAIAYDAKYGAACKRILLDLETGKLRACASVLVLVETINVLTKINRMPGVAGKAELDIRKNIDAILSLPIVWFDLNFPIIKRAAEYRYRISGIDYIHIASMELNSVAELISGDAEIDKVGAVKRLDPLKYAEGRRAN